MKPSHFYYLIAKIVNKTGYDWENDKDLTGTEREAISQGLRDIVFFSPYQVKPVPAGEKRKPARASVGIKE